MSIKQLIRSDLQNLQGYPVISDSMTFDRLHANESTCDPLSNYQWQLNQYPNRNNLTLLSLFCQRYQVEHNQITLTRGSDDGIDLITRLFITPFKDAVVVCPPTFVMYSICARIQGGRIIECPLLFDDFSVNDVLLEEAIDNKSSKLIFLCRPNNPTGNTLSIDKVASICHQASNKAVVVVDEAYIEFSYQDSASSLLPQFDNLIVLRTLSKAYGLAGLRLGVILANEEIIEHLKSISQPFSLATPVLALAKESLTKPFDFQSHILNLHKQRQWVFNQLENLSLVEKIWPSDANFLLIKVRESESVVQYLERHNLLVKQVSPELIRISIGNDEQNQKLIKILRAY